MCKLFAIAGRTSDMAVFRREKFFNFVSNLYLGTAHDNKDQDAAGVYAWSGDRKVHFRSPGPTVEFVAKRQWLSLRYMPAKLYLCHARGAMSAADKVENNHPFVGENIALVHEGWLNEHKTIAEKRGVQLTSETDSETFMRVIDKRRRTLGDRTDWDPVKAMKALLDIANAPTALGFVDFGYGNPALYFARNETSEHKFGIYHSPYFRSNFLVADGLMWETAKELTFKGSVPDDFERLICITEPNVVYKLDWTNQIVTDYYEG
jgi:predicted glutamine amidotransferase